MATQTPRITRSLAAKVLAVVDAGLVSGLGKARPGEMCVEAAVCFALGLPHSDEPPCVGSAVRAFKIRLNDSRWSSDAARAAGMRKLAIAQLGSDRVDQKAFAIIVARETIRQVVPLALRAAAALCPESGGALERAASRCERDGDAYAAANAANAAANAAAYAANAAANAAAYAAAYADTALRVSADIALAALIKLKSPGCKFLSLTQIPA